ncbi:MAG TPA: hypothetical protein VI540_07075 [Gaiellaceae bacterium]|nr:hypothetical protein [Gaiellaceae bacterium]
MGQRIYVAAISQLDSEGRVIGSSEGLAEQQEMVPHALRQALQSLGIEIDAFDRVDVDEIDMGELRYAYSKFAGPSRDLDPDRFAQEA